MNQIGKKDLARIKKSRLFDANWYLRQYPDVAQLGIDPAAHFLKYGGLLRRDPSADFSSSFYLDIRPAVEKKGVNPIIHDVGYRSSKFYDAKRVLYAAYNVACKGQHELAIKLAKDHLPPKLAYTLNVLLANEALARGDERAWLKHVNNYLLMFNIEPLVLAGDGHLLGRLSTNHLDKVRGGPLISVIMPAWNAEETVEHAARSILEQTWENVELLIVDDASRDNTCSVLERIAEKDSRVKIFKNKINVGPYVSKNIALNHARGDYITGHDADDWAHPQRLEKHMEVMIESKGEVKASLAYMIRVKSSGCFGHIGRVTNFSFDGVARKASISCLFEARVIREKLGYWDSVRFGADSEMIARAKLVLGDSMKEINQIGMVCLDHEASLTNHPSYGIDKVKGISPIRAEYRNAWEAWHKSLRGESSVFVDFPLRQRRYNANPEMCLTEEEVLEAMR